MKAIFKLLLLPFKLILFPIKLVFKHPFLAITGVAGFLGWKRFKETEEQDLEEFENWEPKEETVIEPKTESTDDASSSPENKPSP